MEIILSIFLGIGLAAAAGFRVFMPLFALSLAANQNLIPLGESWAWVGGTTALIVLGIATLIEIFAYYIPFVDNLLDTVALPMATIAGTLVMASTLVDLSPLMTWALAIIAGGGSAAAIQSGTATTRLASSATTGGLGNNLVTSTETATAGVVSSLALFFPIIGFVIVLFIMFLGFKLFKRLFIK